MAIGSHRIVPYAVCSVFPVLCTQYGVDRRVRLTDPTTLRLNNDRVTKGGGGKSSLVGTRRSPDEFTSVEGSNVIFTLHSRTRTHCPNTWDWVSIDSWLEIFFPSARRWLVFTTSREAIDASFLSSSPGLQQLRAFLRDRSTGSRWYIAQALCKVTSIGVR